MYTLVKYKYAFVSPKEKDMLWNKQGNKARKQQKRQTCSGERERDTHSLSLSQSHKRPERRKPGKYAGWKRKLVVVKIKVAGGARERESGHSSASQLEGVCSVCVCQCVCACRLSIIHVCVCLCAHIKSHKYEKKKKASTHQISWKGLHTTCTLTDKFLDLCSQISAAQIPQVSPQRKGNNMK